ncbi:MAG: hypothetical protein AAF290_11310 [Pseudomonadota bacterium]
MALLQVNLEANARGGENDLLVLRALVSYQRVIRSGGQDANGNTIKSETGPKQRSINLPKEISTVLELPDYAESTPVDVSITDAQGSRLVSFKAGQPVKNDRSGIWSLKVSLSADIVRRIIAASAPNKPTVTKTISARAVFRPTFDVPLKYDDYGLTVAPISKASISEEALANIFEDSEADSIVAKSEESPNILLSKLNARSVTSVPVSLQGQFEFTVASRETDNAWIWVLAGPQLFVGIVSNREGEESIETVLWLPMSAASESSDGDETRPPIAQDLPVDPSESELLQSPELFADDPGTKCKPFSSPFRIVGERSFHTVLRVTQPEISTDAAAPKPPRPVDVSDYYDIDTSELVLSATLAKGTEVVTSPRSDTAPKGLSKFVVANLATIKQRLSSLVSANSDGNNLSTAAEVLAEERAEVLKSSKGRRILSTETSLDWEDNTPLQASSLSYGHILDYRVRWRNNGYSLGDVLYSLPLAPRQAKSIVTVQSEISDSAFRRESSTITDEIAQGTTRDYGYSDAVQAGLSEWSKGGSKSRNTGAAGGFGLAIGPVVLGGGASHGRAESSSWQQGGRKVTALEEQQLRDSIRQYGEAVRSFETVVVQEQTQAETTTATSEVVRNPNYCHSLTVVYHEILRHLRVDTEVVGARECVFVPLPIKPFTWSRILRWRDSLVKSLMQPRLRWVLPYIEDVRSNFVGSDIPAGMRADQPIKFLSGSVFLKLAIERPIDPEDEDTFERARWISLIPFVSRPVREIYDALKRNADQKDAIFQQDYAPGIAARWVDRLTLSADGRELSGVDFTLASKYRYGSTVRVDFTYVPDGPITRRDLEEIHIGLAEGADLTPGTVANAERVSIKYTTDDFTREKVSGSSQNDLIKIDTGSPITERAEFFLAIDNWEKNDQRATIRREANKLRKHLNEHLEHYHKQLWWGMDRDKLYMLLDTIYAVSEEDGRSVASVVERNPIAILGNSLVYRVAGGAHLGIDGHGSAKELNDYYRDSVVRSEPMRISLPTSGVYAQALLDDCEACEEHFGSTEWILDDKEPELTGLDPSLLSSRRAQAPDLSATTMPASIINLQNAPNVPSPSGFGSAFEALAKSDSFRDMAGLEGTQANAKAAMEKAASLASDFGAKALDLEKTRIAAKVAKEKLATIQKAKDRKQLPADEAEKESVKAVKKMNAETDNDVPADEKGLKTIAKEANRENVEIEAKKGTRSINVKPAKPKSPVPPKPKRRKYSDREQPSASDLSLMEETAERVSNYTTEYFRNWLIAIESVDSVLKTQSIAGGDNGVLAGIVNVVADFLPRVIAKSLDKLLDSGKAKGGFGNSSAIEETYKFVKGVITGAKANAAQSEAAITSQTATAWLNQERLMLAAYGAQISRFDLFQAYREGYETADDKEVFMEDLEAIRDSLRAKEWPVRSVQSIKLIYWERWIRRHFDGKLVDDEDEAKGCIQFRFKVDFESDSGSVQVNLKTIRVKAPNGEGNGFGPIETDLNEIIRQGVLKDPLAMKCMKQICVERVKSGAPDAVYCGWLNEINSTVFPARKINVRDWIAKRAWRVFSGRFRP